MTDPTAFMFGYIGIFLVALGLAFLPVVRRELRARDLMWRENKSLRIAVGIVVAILAGFAFGVAVILAPIVSRGGVEQWALWSAYSLALLAEVLVCSGVGRIRVPMLLCALWSIYVIAWRFHH